MPGIEVHIKGLDAALKALDPHTFEMGLRKGMHEAGDLLGGIARGHIKPHHLTGNFEQQIHTEVKGEGLTIRAHVGVSSGQVPEARPLSYGWLSETGKMPPISAIAKWLTYKPGLINSKNVYTQVGGKGHGNTVRRGSIATISAEKAVRSQAFLIARAIARRGYSFEPIRPFEKAWDEGGLRVQGIIEAAIKREFEK
jgi:hypothetical protein